MSLPDWEEIYYWNNNASKLSCVLDEDKPWKNYNEIVVELINGRNIDSQLGGYPSWIQSNERPKNDNFSLLFQIYDGDVDVTWHDCGKVYVFYNSISKEIEFVLQYH